MSSIVAIMLGGGLGALTRYGISMGVEKSVSINFPLGTLIANLLGCFIIGFCWSYFDRVHISHEFRLFLFTGFLGGFTTFSTYAREGVQFIKSGESMLGFSYILVSNILGLSVVFLGFYLCNRFFRS